MTQKSVRELIDAVAPRVGGVRQKVYSNRLRMFYARREYAKLVGAVKTEMGLDMRLTLAKVRSGGPEKSATWAAWIEMPTSMPPYGSHAFKKLHLTVYLRNEFIKSAPFECVVFTIAHEMAHVVLDSIGHPLCRDERAVDITAMILGFAEFNESMVYQEKSIEAAYVWGAMTWRKRLSLWLQSRRIRWKKNDEHHRFMKAGYLTQEEVTEAIQLIKKLR